MVFGQYRIRNTFFMEFSYDPVHLAHSRNGSRSQPHPR